MTRNLLTCLMLAGASPLAITPAHAVAQGANSEERLVSFNIEAQPLANALQQFAQQSNVDLLYSPDLVEGRRAPALRERVTISRGLDLLLIGSGITARQLSPSSYTLQAESKSASADAGAVTSGPLTGTVVSAANGAALPGARIRISGTDLEAVSDDAGRFHFPSVPAGQNVTVEYLGDTTKTVSVPATAAGRQNLVVAIGQPSDDEIVVVGYRSSLQKALNQQLRAPNS